MKVFLLLCTCFFAVYGKSRYTGGKSSRSTIVGGEDAYPGEFPYQISIIAEYYFEEHHNCGGSIYSKDWIITAGHCVYDHSPRSLTVVAGDHNLKEEEKSEQRMEVSKVILHEEYIPYKTGNDIALMKLKTSLQFNDRVQAIPLPNSGEILIGDCIVTGWGRLSYGGAHSDILQKVTVPIIPDDVCREESYYSPSDIYDSMLCAGYLEGGKDSCQGDSGGPLMCDGVLGGIVSWGVGCAYPGYPGIYTEVSYFVDWIEKTTKEN